MKAHIDRSRSSLKNKIQSVHSSNFEALALELFRFQVRFNPLYERFVRLLGLSVHHIDRVSDIPFLPIRFFKTYPIKTGNWSPDSIFSSSGTTGAIPSKHFIRSLSAYLTNTVCGFAEQYGSPREYCFLALLPSYLERQGSSLVYMVRHFIQNSNYEQSGFFLSDYPELLRRIDYCQKKNIPTVLIGVSFALLDLASKHELKLDGMVVMETGGMKGRREEMTRESLHQILKERFNIANIHSEYGMTELQSQAYSTGQGIFTPASTLRVLIKEITDPLTPEKFGKTGVINVIDLANIDSCSFIATEDLGRLYPDGRFELIGRLDGSEWRGCNLMVQELDHGENGN